MVVLDNLVVTTALPTIRADLGATLESLEWTVNAYTLAFAVLLLTGAALGDRFGRRRMFAHRPRRSSRSPRAAAALAPTTGALIAARARCRASAPRSSLPLTLTLLCEAFPAGKRGLALGAWSGISGLGVALGPLVGGAVVDGISWHWIFWLNVPIGLVARAARRRGCLTESHGPARHARPARPRARRRRPARRRLRHRPRRRAGLDEQRRSLGVARRRRGAARRLRRPGSCARRDADAADALLPLARVRRHQRRRRWRCSSASSARSSCWRSSSSRRRGSRRWRPGLRDAAVDGMPMLVAPIAGILSDRDRLAAADGARPRAAGGAMAGWPRSRRPTSPYSRCS